jgi:hypothetical protein
MFLSRKFHESGIKLWLLWTTHPPARPNLQMKDAIQDAPQTAQQAPVENPLQSLYNGVMHGFETLTGKSEAPPPPAHGPLQLMPEIYGHAKTHNVQKDTPKDTPHSHTVAAKPHDSKPDAGPAREAKDSKDTKAGKASETPQMLADRTLDKIAKADLKGWQQPSQEAQDVVRGFIAEKQQLPAKDKGQALKHFEPGFNLAIRNADSAYVTAEKQALPNITIARENFVRNNSTYNSDFKDAVSAAKTLPEGKERDSAARLLAHVGGDGAKMPKKEELTAVFNSNPRVLDSLMTLVDSQKSVFDANRQLDTAAKPVLNAALEQDRARLAYERAAQSVGNRDLARSLDSERRQVVGHALELASPPEELRSVTKI